MLLSNKSWLIPALLLLLIWVPPTQGRTLSYKQIAEDPVWQLLLHTQQDQAQIDSPEFILSSADFSSLHELEQTLALYQQQPKSTFCRFPARITYLARYLPLHLAPDRFQECPELLRYRQMVPFDQVELVFASEVLSSASSMMGHVFLKASGQSGQQHVMHTLAFFTEINTFNPITLMYDSTVGGMPGYFIVRPYARDITQYNLTEQRNLWEFVLRTTDEQRELLQLHLWELRGLNITYYFQSFNCATLTLELLALFKPEVRNEQRLFVSPADVVKAAEKHELIVSTRVRAADLWLSHALGSQLNREQHRQVNRLLWSTEGSVAALDNDVAIHYLSVQAEQAARTGLLNTEQYHLLSSQLPIVRPNLDLSRYKHPAKTPQDSALSVSLATGAWGNYGKLTMLSSGHQLIGDNRQYLSESELLMGQVAVTAERVTGQLQLDELTLYSVKSYIPDNPIFSLWSGEFYAGWQRITFANSATDILEKAGRFETSGALGKSYQLHSDMLFFMLSGAGMTTNLSDNRVFAQLKAGIVMNLMYGTKLTAQYQWHTAKMTQSSNMTVFDLALSWFPLEDYAVTLQWAGHRSHGLSYHDTQLSLFRFF